MSKRQIIAIVGLPGSGKSETINYLMEKYKWPRVYFGDVTFDEMKKRGLEINEQNERLVREGLRQEFGKLHYAKQVIEKIKGLPSDSNVLVESLYDWEEYKLFKEEFGDTFSTVAIYVSPETRYERLSVRPIRPLTKDVAKSRDYAQIENLGQAGPIAMAAYVVDNEEGGLENLHQKINKVMDKILK